jgi:outer membrane protein insertion porin family
VKVVRQDDLRTNIYTTASYCNSFILKPFCWISKSKYFYTREYLDHQELHRDVLRIRIYYWKRGYRETEVDTAVVPRGHNQVGVTFTIREGPATTVSDVVVSQDSSILSQREINDRISLSRNAPLNLIRLDSSRFNLQARMFDKGYADAEVDTATVIDSTSHTAVVKFTLLPKYKTTVEDIVISGNDDVDDRTILKSLSFHVGDIFRRSDMLRSQRALYESNLFRRAAIEPRPPIDISIPDSAKIVVINVTEAPFHEARVSAGFNTIDFGQLESRFTSYNFRGGARRLQLQGVVGNLFAKSLNGRGIFRNSTLTPTGQLARYFVPTYNASIDLTQPWFGSPHNTLSAGIFSHRRSAPGIYIDRGYGSSFTFTREMTERAPLSFNYRFEISKVDAGDVYFCINFGVCDQPTLESLRGNQKLSPVTVTAGLDRTNDPFSPNRGFRTNGSVEHASTFTASDFRYNRATADGAAYHQIRKRGSLAAHINIGWVHPLGSTAQATGIAASVGDGVLHPRKRFYAGGAHSVRGFGENQLGPRVLTIPIGTLQSHDSLNLACTSGTDVTQCNPDLANLKDRDFEPRPLGGNFVLEGSVEARFPLWRDISGAAFVDAGMVSQRINADLPRRKAAITPGFGFRYKSPVGPIRADIGFNPGRSESLPVITESIVNGQRTLVTLRQRRGYSPTSGGILNRMVLHLSIGEPF